MTTSTTVTQACCITPAGRVSEFATRGNHETHDLSQYAPGSPRSTRRENGPSADPSIAISQHYPHSDFHWELDALSKLEDVLLNVMRQRVGRISPGGVGPADRECIEMVGRVMGEILVGLGLEKHVTALVIELFSVLKDYQSC